MLNFLKKSLKPPVKEIFVGLALRDGAGSVMLIKADREQKLVDIIDEKQFTFTNSWENLIEDVDETLYQLEQKNNIHADKVILFLYSHLVDQETSHIKQPYLSKIRDLAKEMELELMGFVEFHEAIALYGEHIENMALTASVVEVDKSVVTVFIYKGGKLVNTLSSSKTEDLNADLEGLFTQLKGDFLPTKIVIYDSLGVDGDIESVLTHQWSEDLFVQIPQVEIVPEQKLKQALLQAFGLQLFGDISQKAIGTLDVKDAISETPSAAVEGFIVGEDIREHELTPTPPMPVEEPYQPSQTSTRRSPLLFISSFFAMMQERTQSKIPLPLIVIVSLILIAGSLFSIEYFFHKATLTLFFKSPTINKEVTLGENLALRKVDEKVTESDSTKATGKKKIGTKAKGDVTVLNLEKSERTLKSGTVLLTDKGTKFILDSDVKIASASSSVTSGGDVTIVTGKQKGSITAADIGKGGNIDKNTTLHIEGISVDSIRATADKTFTGGTEEEVQTVAKTDLEQLTKAVEDKIKTKGDSIVSQKTKGTRIVKDLTEITITDKKYSKEVAQEASEVSLQVTATVTFYTYNDADFKKTISSSLASSIPDGFQLPEGNVSYEVLKAENKDGKIQLTLKVSAKPQRKLDAEAVRKEVAGKKTTDLKELLKQNYKIDGYQVSIATTLPLFKSRLPFLSRNIEIRSQSL